ncbi:MAG: A/G-specific adenine glycosylase [Candidatus Methanofastidiosia archaeon]|jgi:A/G-specific adenine glycosylase
MNDDTLDTDMVYRYTRDVPPEVISKFQSKIYKYYKKHGRKFPWRETDNPYYILVSEFMLQQTQTKRVLTKYDQFIHRFPEISVLADSSLKDVVKEWQGLGYNRRAMYLHKTAQKVVNEYNGCIPDNIDILKTFPGIGDATSAAIAAFAFKKPVVLIETNIRVVYIYFFFTGTVKDADIRPVVSQTIDCDNPREWYYALMDYGVMLKKKVKNPGRRSAHYTKQEPFEGSNRQIRGKILKWLSTGSYSENELISKIDADTERVLTILDQLEKEGFIVRDGTNNTIYIE